MEDLTGAAERLEAGTPFPPGWDVALLHGSSIGGVRPKVLLNNTGRKLIAKLSSRSDPYPVAKSEAVGMRLAAPVGLDVAATESTVCLNHGVLLVERFDRTPRPGQRHQLVSALTMLGWTR